MNTQSNVSPLFPEKSENNIEHTLILGGCKIQILGNVEGLIKTTPINPYHLQGCDITIKDGNIMIGFDEGTEKKRSVNIQGNAKISIILDDRENILFEIRSTSKRNESFLSFCNNILLYAKLSKPYNHQDRRIELKTATIRVFNKFNIPEENFFIVKNMEAIS